MNILDITRLVRSASTHNPGPLVADWQASVSSSRDIAAALDGVDMTAEDPDGSTARLPLLRFVDAVLIVSWYRGRVENAYVGVGRGGGRQIA